MPFMSVSGPAPTALARAINERINEGLDQGLSPEACVGIALACALDLHRANFGDLATRRFVKEVTRQRLAHPPAHWGVSSTRDHLDG